MERRPEPPKVKGFAEAVQDYTKALQCCPENTEELNRLKQVIKDAVERRKVEQAEELRFEMEQERQREEHEWAEMLNYYDEQIHGSEDMIQ
jgi:hypothetical protein